MQTKVEIVARIEENVISRELRGNPSEKTKSYVPEKITTEEVQEWIPIAVAVDLVVAVALSAHTNTTNGVRLPHSTSPSNSKSYKVVGEAKSELEDW